MKVKKVYQYKFWDYSKMNDTELFNEVERLIDKLPQKDIISPDNLNESFQIIVMLREALVVLTERYPTILQESFEDWKIDKMLKKLNIQKPKDGQED